MEMNGAFDTASLLLFGAGAGFVGSGLGMMIVALRRPTLHSARNSLSLAPSWGF